METLYWFCNECDEISSTQICKCKNSWKCPNCSVVNRVNEYTDNTHQFIECSTCGFCKRTLLGTLPNTWSVNTIEHKITLTYNLDSSRDLNARPNLNYDRTIIIEIIVDNIDNLINGSYFDSIIIKSESTDFITLYEKYFIYALLISYFPLGPNIINISQTIRNVLYIQSLTDYISTNQESPVFLRNVDRYIQMYTRFHISSILTQNLFSADNNYASQVEAVISRSLNESKPMYSASSESLSSIKDTEICFKEILLEEASSDVTFNKSCPICMDDFSETDTVIKQKCCNNV